MIMIYCVGCGCEVKYPKDHIGMIPDLYGREIRYWMCFQFVEYHGYVCPVKITKVQLEMVLSDMKRIDRNE